MSLNNILNKPFHLEGVGDIYPIQLKNWDEFEMYVSILIHSDKHFETNGEHPLLDILIKGLNDPWVPKALERLFQLTLQNDEVKFIIHNAKYYEFKIDENYSITSENYPDVREVIMRQNILFEPKVYKNPAMKKWAEKVLKTRGKNAPNVTLEDMISTVSVMAGKHYWDLAEYTIYQLKYDFQRICRLKDYDMQSLLVTNPYMDKSNFKMSHFSENIDLYVNPWEGIFKEKSSFKNINSAVSQ
jgi:hypothetical protein